MTHFLNFESAGGRVWKVDRRSSYEGFNFSLYANRYNCYNIKADLVKKPSGEITESKHVSAIQEYLSQARLS